MRTVKLLSWHHDVAAKADLLRQGEVRIDPSPLVRSSAVIGELARINPAALVLDLDKLPSHSREIALMLRASKSARHIPILFAGSLASPGGLPAKYERLRSELPDIPYAVWADAPQKLAELLASGPSGEPVVPQPRIYSAPLTQKLGILSRVEKPASKSKLVTLIAVPEEFPDLLGDTPDTVKFNSSLSPSTTLAICFVRSLRDLASTLDLLSLRLPASASAWIAYPKRKSGQNREFNENDVRGMAIAAGFVDYKICSIDSSWSALKFARRKSPAQQFQQRLPGKA